MYQKSFLETRMFSFRQRSPKRNKTCSSGRAVCYGCMTGVGGRGNCACQIPFTRGAGAHSLLFLCAGGIVSLI
jgi:hypothetical protein